MQATLTSTKSTQMVTGDLSEIFLAALGAEAALQPAYGITIECDDGRAFECIDGRIAVYTGGEDGDEGAVMMVGDDLMIAWDQGIRTRFADTDLQPN